MIQLKVILVSSLSWRLVRWKGWMLGSSMSSTIGVSDDKDSEGFSDDSDSDEASDARGKGHREVKSHRLTVVMEDLTAVASKAMHKAINRAFNKTMAEAAQHSL